jgi:phage-related holin
VSNFHQVKDIETENSCFVLHINKFRIQGRKNPGKLGMRIPGMLDKDISKIDKTNPIDLHIYLMDIV